MPIYTRVSELTSDDVAAIIGRITGSAQPEVEAADRKDAHFHDADRCCECGDSNHCCCNCPTFMSPSTTTKWANEPCVRSLVINGPCVTVTLIDGRAFIGKFSEVLP